MTSYLRGLLDIIEKRLTSKKIISNVLRNSIYIGKDFDFLCQGQ